MLYGPLCCWIVLYVLITRKGTQWSGYVFVRCSCGLGTPSVFLSGHEYAMNITELAERPGDWPEEYSVLIVFKKEVHSHRR